MAKHQCKQCGKEFYSRSKKRVFCSHPCFAESRKMPPVTCEWCGKNFQARRKKSKFGLVRFCSRACSNGATNKKRREMRIFNTGGYLSVYAPDHPKAYGGRVREHVLVAEKMLGRYLENDEMVHHINRLRDDNRVDNLFVCEDVLEHRFLEKVCRILESEFIREKGLGEELTKYVKEKFMGKYNRGDFKKYGTMKPKKLFESLFGFTDDSGKLRRFQ